MQIKYKLLDPSLPHPAYQTPGSVGLDLPAAEDVTIPPHTLAVIPTGVIIQQPENCAMILASRSSLPRKKGLMIPNGIGVFDHDYCGPEDQIYFQAYNFTDQAVTLHKGERICQVFFPVIEKPEPITVEHIKDENRGGLGSTDGYHK